MSVDITEEFKPIPVRRASGPLGRLAFGLRLIVDLQLLTCIRFLAPRLSNAEGAVLDVGCGEMPFRPLLPADVRYTGLDVPEAVAFGMSDNKKIIPFDGKTIPLPDNSHDLLLCTEVLEHAVDPVILIQEMHRVLRPGGTLLATVPFAARVHHAPFDFHRFTRFQLATMLSSFTGVQIIERGNDISVIANKLIVLCVRLAVPKKRKNLLWTVPLFVMLAPCTLVALAFAHLSLFLGMGSKDDPLGYGIVARKGSDVEI